jgi:hypothetical protein
MMVEGTTLSSDDVVSRPHVVQGGRDLEAQTSRVMKLAHDCRKRQPSLGPYTHATLLPQLSFVLRILRTFSKRPSMFLIGPSASDLVILASYICHYRIVQGTHCNGANDQSFVEEFSDLCMQAGTKDEKLVYFVNLVNCSDTILAKLNDFICSGDITSMLSTDQFAAVSTLMQAKLVADNVPVNKRNALAIFLRQARRNLRVALYLPDKARNEGIILEVCDRVPKLMEAINMVWCVPMYVQNLTGFKSLAGIVFDGEEDLATHMQPKELHNFIHLLANFHAAMLNFSPSAPRDVRARMFTINGKPVCLAWLFLLSVVPVLDPGRCSGVSTASTWTSLHSHMNSLLVPLVSF